MRVFVIASLALVAAACGSSGSNPPAPPPPPPKTGCNGTTTSHPLANPAMHIAAPNPVVYADTPPSGGDHRPIWGAWGEYSTIPPEIWVHNLEHGGAVLLYSDTAGAELAGALRSYAQNRPADAGGEFRYVLAPFAGLPTKIAVITWTWVYEAGDVCPGELDTFLAAHYRMATEDIPNDGSFREGFIGR